MTGFNWLHILAVAMFVAQATNWITLVTLWSIANPFLSPFFLSCHQMMESGDGPRTAREHFVSGTLIFQPLLRKILLIPFSRITAVGRDPPLSYLLFSGKTHQELLHCPRNDCSIQQRCGNYC